MVKSKQTLRDQYFKIIGYIETDEKGIQTLKDSYFRIKGRYYPDTDVTKDFYGKIIGRGNILSVLLQTK